MENNFRFFLPVDVIEKGRDKNGKEVMKIKGVASTSSQDSDGEVLDVNGFDLSEFSQINWNHKGKDDAAAIIGEPVNWNVKNNLLDVEGVLYPEVPMARAVYNLMKAYKKSPRGNRLKMSVEGKVLERDPFNPSKVKKAKITAVAICPHPVNGETFVDLVQKGYTSDIIEFDEKEVEEISKALDFYKMLEEDVKFKEYVLKARNLTNEDNLDEVNEEEQQKLISKYKEKAITTSAPIQMESVEGGQGKLKKLISNKRSLLKSEIYEQIFSYFYPISNSQAKSIFNFIEKISVMENTPVTDETLKKAFEILELASEKTKETTPPPTPPAASEEDLSKAKKVETVEEDDKEMVEKAKQVVMKAYHKDKNKEDYSKMLVEKGYGEKVIAKAVDAAIAEVGKVSEETQGGKIEEVGSQVKKGFDNVSALLDINQKETNLKFSAISDIFKSQAEKIDSLEKALKQNEEFVSTLKIKLEKVEKEPGIKRSISGVKAIERFDTTEGGEVTYNIADKNQCRELISKMQDLSGFGKSEKFDIELMQAASDLEIAKSISPRMLGKLASHKIKVVVS